MAGTGPTHSRLHLVTARVRQLMGGGSHAVESGGWH
jgi:hypothetical protein